MAWADRDPVEQAEIGYSAPRGIPLAVFRGRVVYPGEEQWLDSDRAAVYDWLAKEAANCPDCGQPLTECTATGNAYAYRAEAVRCHACHAIAMEAARLAQTQPSPAAAHRYRIHHVEAN